MILLIVMILLSVIYAWITAKADVEHEKVEMAWRFLALAAVEELYKQKKKLEGQTDEADTAESEE